MPEPDTELEARALLHAPQARHVDRRVAVPGKRSSGTGAGNWAVVPEGWHGDLPSGVQRIDAPTPYVWVIGRTQTNWPADYEQVHAVQDGYPHLSIILVWDHLRTLAERVGSERRYGHVTIGSGPCSVGPDRFFLGCRADEAPPTLTSPTGPRHVLDVSGLDRLSAEAVESAPKAAHIMLQSLIPTMPAVTNGWQMNTSSMGVYGGLYAKRVVVAMPRLGANPPEDVIYPLLMADIDGNLVDGSRAWSDISET